VFIKGDNGLLVAVLEYMEPAPVETMHGVVSFSDNRVHQDKVRVSVQNRCNGAWSGI